MRQSKNEESGLLVDGLRRITETPAYRAAFAEIEREVTALYAKPICDAGPFRRLLLERARRREINRRAEELAPSDALYLSGAR
jgi:hypothetical protein